MSPLAPERRAELLAAAPRAALTELAERCLSDAPLSALSGPEVGVIVLEVREPVVGERFQLAEVLATRTELVRRGAPGWALRLGDDREASLAAAVLDSEAEAGGPRAEEVADLCRRTESTLAAAEEAEWQELAPTVVEFEEPLQ